MASVIFFAVIALLLIPVGMVWLGFMPGTSTWLRIALICVGLLIARLVKPLSILLGKDLKIISYALSG